MSGDEDLRRLRWRCRRGLLELDLILLRFDAFKSPNVVHFFPPDETHPEELGRALAQRLHEDLGDGGPIETEFVEGLITIIAEMETQWQREIAEEFVKLRRTGLDFADAIEALVRKGPPEWPGDEQDLLKQIRRFTRFVLQDGHSMPGGKTYGRFVEEMFRRILG